MTPTDKPRIVTRLHVEMMRQLHTAGKHVAVLALDRRLRKDGNWTTPPTTSRAALNERMNYFTTRSRLALNP